MYIKKKRNLKIISKITHATGKYLQGLIGQESVKEASNQQKLYTILLAWLWTVRKSLFRFCSLNSECVMCVFLQCDRRKQLLPLSWQNRHHR